MNQPNPMDNDHTKQPVFNVPTVILVAIASFVLVHVYRVYVLSPREDLELLLQFAFIPQRYVGSELNELWPNALYWSPITYSFLHGDWGHLILNSLWLVAFGAVVAKRLSLSRFLILCLVGSIAAAALHYVFNAGQLQLMIGASGVVSACTGAACRFAFPDRGNFHLAENAPIQSLTEVMQNRRAMTFMIVWFAINILFGVGIVSMGDEGNPIAWIAHIGGFLGGLFILPLLARRRD